MKSTAIYPGTFDPITFGHLDLIQRATGIFDHIIVGVAQNTHKNPLFGFKERLTMVEKATRDIPKVEVVPFQGLVIEFAKKKKVNVLIRGLRMISDFEYEFQMALTNRRLNEDIETIFLMPSENYSYLSSTLLKEAASLGADLSSFVPDFVAQRLGKKVGR